MKIAAIDFEFNNTKNHPLNIVCAAVVDLETKEQFTFWLDRDNKALEAFKAFLQNQYQAFVAYGAAAEARCFLSMGLNPLDFKWIDLFYEYRLITNHFDHWGYGNQLRDGKVIRTRRPPRKFDPDFTGDKVDKNGVLLNFVPSHSLVEATYKMLNIKRDETHKEKMRDLIISSPDLYHDHEKQAILDYCLEDTLLLGPMLDKFEIEYNFIFMRDLDDKLLVKNGMWERGRYAAHTAIMEAKGYPIDYEKTQNFSKSVQNILYECALEINQLFPAIMPFRWNKKRGAFSMAQVNIREWIKHKPHHFGDKKRWKNTDTGALSLSLDAFTEFYPFAHDYPKDNFGAQIVRYLKLKQSLNGFTQSADSKRKTFWDSVGDDKRVRPYLNPFRAQSSRSQPAATGFMFLKPAWQRALVIGEKGMALAGVDYGSQEFFISALLSKDRAMIEAYLSGDIYVATGKAFGVIPKGGTAKTHPRERQQVKSLVLGISYLMTKVGLSIKLSQDLGHEVTEDEAQDLIDQFYDSYPDFYKWQKGILSTYEEQEYLLLSDGWAMGPDNDNVRSFSNYLVQGEASSIMRKAVDLAVTKYGLTVLFTLHDALYIEYKVGDEESVVKLMRAMQEAFMFYFEGEYKALASKIKLDPFAWSRDYEKDSIIKVGKIKIPASNLYLDKRAKAEYDKFSVYFEDSAANEL